jgi:hypothetical protein
MFAPTTTSDERSPKLAEQLAIAIANSCKFFLRLHDTILNKAT